MNSNEGYAIISDLVLGKIAHDSRTLLKKGSAEVMSDVISDTLFGEKRFPQFDTDHLTPICGDETKGTHVFHRDENTLEFGYHGHTYKVRVEMVS